MGLTPKPVKLSEIFNKEYEIDFYQREYKWSDEKQTYKPVLSLLEDIFYRFDLDYKENIDPTIQNISNYEWYYLNSFMTNEDKGTTFLVDGQQRLTTLTLLFIKLYHLLKKFDVDQDKINFISNNICGFGVERKKYWLGFDNRENMLDDLFLNDINFSLTPENLTEQNIQSNYTIIHNYLINKLDTKHKIECFRLYLFERLQMVELKIDKPKDVAMVFEVINDRGIPLKPYEILKGKILGQINKDDINGYINSWDSSIRNVEKYKEEHLDRMFSTLFRSKFTDGIEQYRKLEIDKYHKTIFTEEFNAKINLNHNEQKAKEFIKNILPYYSQLYSKTLKYYEQYDKEYECIYFNRLNDQDMQFPLILSAIKLNDNQEDQKIKLVSKLFDRNYTFLNLMGSYKSNDFNDSMVNLCIKLRDKELMEIQSCFDEQLLKDINKAHQRSDIKEIFKYELFYLLGYKDFSKTFLRYFFSRIEFYISEKSKIPHADYYQLVMQGQGNNVHHIDHILSNNDNNVRLFKDEEEFNLHRNRLGALVLLKGRDNISLGDKLYTEKLKIYATHGTNFARTLESSFYNSNLDFTDFIANSNLSFKPYDVFNLNSIEEREKLIFNLCKLIWEIN